MSMFWTPRQSIILQISNNSVLGSDTGSPWESYASMRVNSSGEMEEDGWKGGDAASYSFVQDLVIPAAMAPSCEIRMTSVSFDAQHGSWFTSPGADGTWFPLTSTRTWTVQDTSSTSGLNSTTATMEIRFGSSGSAWASATMTFSTLNGL